MNRKNIPLRYMEIATSGSRSRPSFSYYVRKSISRDKLKMLMLTILTMSRRGVLFMRS